MSKALEPITIIASEFCEDIGDSNETQHTRFVKKLLRGYKIINRYLSPELDVLSQIFPADGQIELPCDFQYETKIGLLKNNCLVTLDLNKDLTINNQRFTDSQIQTNLNSFWDGSIDPGQFFPFYNAFRGTNFVGELYGMGCGFHSNNWYNIKDGVLEIGSMIMDMDDVEVVIEYKSDGLKDGFKLIPAEMMECVNYKAKELFYEDTKPTLSESMAAKYKVEYQKLKRLYCYRDPYFMAHLWKSFDKPARY